jgi:hypothetical protein
VTDDATGGSAENTMVTCNMPRDTADDGALDASFGVGCD